VSSTREVELLEAEARYCRERVSLLRARLYGRGEGTSARLQELERERERAEQRLRAPAPDQPRAGDRVVLMPVRCRALSTAPVSH
jgi:hypothetical protein